MTAAVTTELPTLSLDALLDWADQNVDAERRDRAMESAHRKGLEACELCGRALKSEGAVRAQDPDSTERFAIGPECTKRLRKAGLL